MAQTVADIFRVERKSGRRKQLSKDSIFIDQSFRIPRNVRAADINRLISEYASKSSPDHDAFMIVWRRLEFYAMHFLTDQTGHLRRKLYDEIYANFWKYILEESNVYMKLGAWYAMHAFFFTQPESIRYNTIMITKDGWKALQAHLLIDQYPTAKRILSELAPFLVVVAIYPELEEHVINYQHNITPEFLQTSRQYHSILEKQYSHIEMEHLKFEFHALNRNDEVFKLDSYHKNTLLQYDQLKNTLQLGDELVSTNVDPGKFPEELAKTRALLDENYNATQHRLETESNNAFHEEDEHEFTIEGDYIVATNSPTPNQLNPVDAESSSADPSVSSERGHMPSFSLQTL